VLDLEKKTARRLIEKQNVRFYQLSPDEKQRRRDGPQGLAGEQPAADVRHRRHRPRDRRTPDDRDRGRARLRHRVELDAGLEERRVHPERNLGHRGRQGQGPDRRRACRRRRPEGLKTAGVPSFDPGDGEYAPVMDDKGRSFYAVGDGELWRVDPESGKGTSVGKIPGWKIVSLVQPFGRPTLLSQDGKTVWVWRSSLRRLPSRESSPRTRTAESRDSSRSTWIREPRGRFFRSRRATCPSSTWTAARRTGEIVFAATDQQHLHDLWVLDAKTGKTRQITHLNPEMERYELGQARLIEWRSMAGQPLKGALLLPPDYKPAASSRSSSSSTAATTARGC
jgi:dipeptidyl aminopeptidase/acylaminoacyl peptidase